MQTLNVRIECYLILYSYVFMIRLTRDQNWHTEQGFSLCVRHCPEFPTILFLYGTEVSLTPLRSIKIRSDKVDRDLDRTSISVSRSHYIANHHMFKWVFM